MPLKETFSRFSVCFISVSVFLFVWGFVFRVSKNEDKRKLIPHERASYGPSGMACWLRPPRRNLCEGEGMWVHTSRWTRLGTTIPTDGNADVTGKTKEPPNPSAGVGLTAPPASYTLIRWPGGHLRTPEGTTSHHSKVKRQVKQLQAGTSILWEIPVFSSVQKGNETLKNSCKIEVMTTFYGNVTF